MSTSRRCRQHYTNSRQGSEVCASTDQKILHNVWQEVECRFDVARAARGTHIELY
jgi:hypothetical protein